MLTLGDIVQLVDHPDIWALFDHSPAPTYYMGHIAILGDAAHASTPHQGAGAGQAMEDAFILASLLGDENTKSVSDIPAAFNAYDAVRRPRSQKVVSTSREAGVTYAFQGPAGDDKEKIREELLRRYGWIWEEDMQKQEEQAKLVLRGGKEVVMWSEQDQLHLWMKNIVVSTLSRVLLSCRRLWQ
jgi:salicylate hydroxylase